MAPHFPYKPSPTFLNRFHGREATLGLPEVSRLLEDRPGRRYPLDQQSSMDKWRLRYDEWLADADNAFGEFVSRLDRRDVWRNTIFLVSADHGESFQGGVWGHGDAAQLRQIIHIPLIVRLPGQTESRSIAVTADQTAIAPTILELAGLQIPYWVDGSSLVPSLLHDNGDQTGGVAFTQYLDPENYAFNSIRSGSLGVIDMDRQYLIDITTMKGALYRLSEANLQNREITSEEPERAASMRKLILDRFPEFKKKES